MFAEAATLVCLLVSTEGLYTDARIYDGSTAAPDEFPQTVSIRRSNKPTCGGTLLHAFAVLTAGHCLEGAVSEYSIQYNVTTISQRAEYVVSASQFILHPDYNYTTTAILNDIGIILLAKVIPLDSHVQRVKLTSQGSQTPTYYLGTIVGWGTLDSAGTLPTTLQKATVVVYRDDDCERLLIMGPTNRTINICAGRPEGGIGPCSGDGGGPLFVVGFQVGIMSWLIRPCAQTGYPAAYTKVSTYVPWIEETLQKYRKKYLGNKGL